MKTIRKSEQGIAHLAPILLVVAIVAIGLVAYRVKTANDSSTTASSQSASATAPAKIQNKSDLRTSSQALQDAPINNDLNPKQLDGNINSLL